MKKLIGKAHKLGLFGIRAFITGVFFNKFSLKSTQVKSRKIEFLDFQIEFLDFQIEFFGLETNFEEI